MSTPAERLAELGITLPEPAPAGVYRPAIRTGNQIYVAGQLPMRDGALVHPGILGAGVTVEQGYEAARVCAINALGATNALLGSLDDLRIIRAAGLVAATPEFTEHPAVINGASEFLKDIFGDERGIGARVAFGVASLPLGSSVEFELLLEILLMSRIDFVTGAPEKYMPLVQELTLVPNGVEQLLAGHAARDLQHTAEGEWSAARVLAHMISYARHNGDFINQIAWMTTPERQPWDEDDEVSRQGLATKNGATLLEALREAIGETVELLSHTPDAQWGRPGVVPGYGRRSLRQQLRGHIDHLVDHTAQVESLLSPQPAAVAAE